MKNAASTIYFSSGSNTATARRSRTFDRPQAAPYVLGAVTGPNNKTVASDGLSSDLHEESDGDIPALRLRRKKTLGGDGRILWSHQGTLHMVSPAYPRR